MKKLAFTVLSCIVTSICLLFSLSSCNNVKTPSDMTQNQESAIGGDNNASNDESIKKIASEGLEYKLSDDSTYYIVKGIGECADTDIVIPSLYKGVPVKEIASYAFNNQKITSLTTLENMTSIEQYAFNGCTELKKIILSKDIFSIAYDAFSNCAKLDTIIIDAANLFYEVEGNVLFAKEKALSENMNHSEKVLFMYPRGLLSTSYVVPGDVDYIAPYAFFHCDNLKNIQISDGVSIIGNDAFSYCANLESIAIAESITMIEENAFYKCSSLRNISVGNSITSIGKDAFRGTAYYYDSLNWIEGVLYVGKYLVTVDFYQLSDVCIVREGTILIADSAFSNNIFESCNVLSIALPNSLKYIGDNAFEYCDSLRSIVVPDSVLKIGVGAFWCCNSLLSITLGKSVQKANLNMDFLGSKFYELCNKSNLTLNEIGLEDAEILVTSGESKIFTTDDGFVLCPADNGVVLIDYYGGETSIVIPNEVTQIGKYAFYKNTAITSVFIGDNVEYIGKNAFRDCTSLDKVKIEGSLDFNSNPFQNTLFYSNKDKWENGLFYIGTVLVEYDNSRTEIIIKEGTTEIYASVFSGDKKLISVTIPSSVMKIGDYAFDGCVALKSVALPPSLKSIGQGAFRKCKKLTSIIIPDSVVTIGARAFEDCETLSSVTLGKRVSYIGYDAFRVWGSWPLKLVYIESIESWCKIQFENYRANPCNQGYCTLSVGGKTKIKIPDGTAEIKPYAFCGVKNSEIYLPDSLKYIGESAFLDYKGSSIYFSGGVAEWCNITFANAYANPLCSHGYLHLNNYADLIYNLVIPASVSEIKDYAFINANGIVSLNFESGSVCSSIGAYAFRNVPALQALRLPPSVKTIGEHAFDSCYKLQIANINTGVSTIGEDAFNGCTKLAEVMCGQALRNINKNAFSGCTALETIYYFGAKTSWKKTDVDGTNAEWMLAIVYFYSEEKPIDVGNYWHYVDNGVALWGTVTLGEVPSYVEHRTELYAEWFEKVFVESSGTFSELLYSDLMQDQDYLDAITAWERLHIAIEPSHHLSSGMISKKDIYKLIIYDMLGGSSSYEDLANLYDTLDDEATSYMYKFLRKVSSATIIELDDLADYDTSDYTEQFNEIFGGIDKLDSILKHFDCLYDAVFVCAQYQAFSNMDEAFKNVLAAIYNDTENPTDLRNAALECIECYEAGVQNVLTVIADATIRNELKMLMGEMMDEVWTRVVYSIPGGAGVILMEGLRGIRALSDGLFQLDDRNEAFYRLEANVLLERAILRILPELYNAYTQTFDEYEATTYMRAIDMYKCVAISGFDYCIQLLEVKASAVGTSKEDKAECNRLIKEIEAFKETKQSNFKKFEDATLQHYHRLYSAVSK